MKLHQKIVEYAIKNNNNAEAARRYHTSRQQVRRWRKKYQYHKYEGLVQVYRKCLDSGYKRSDESMCKQIKKLKNYEKPKKVSYPKNKYEPLRRRFKSEKEMYKSFYRYSVRTNNIARRALGFKTPNEMVEEYFMNVA